MHIVTTLLLAVSLGTLALGVEAWRLTSSRSVIFNTLLGSAGLLFASYFFATGQNLPLSYVLPFFVAMIFAGRAGGLWWRGREKEHELQRPAVIMFVIAALALGAASAAYIGA